MGELDPAARLTEPSARVGTVVDRYTLVRVLGQGGMGAVYEARHATLSRRFAIKFLLPGLAANRDILRRFENEAKAAGGLEHPNLAAVTDFGRATDGSPYIVMEYLHGDDCAKLLKRLGPLPVPRAVNIVVQACRGLAVAHQAGIVHRDLKPENLFVTDAGDGSDHVKVLDFGIAKLRVSDASVITGTGATFGTAFYMSPEQARGAGEVDARSDVWSMGVVLYELLSGQKPFVGEQFLQVIHQILSVEAAPLAPLRPGLPPALLGVIERAMAKELPARVPSIVAFAEALAPFAGTAGAVAAVSSRAMAVAETAATPATGIGLELRASVAARANTGSDEVAFSEPAVRFTARPDGAAVSMAPGRKGSKTALLVISAVAVAVAGGAGLFLANRKAAAPVAAPTSAAPPSPTPAPVPAPIAPAAPPPVTQPAPAAAAVAPSPSGSPTSERSEHRSNKRAARAVPAAPVAAPPPESPKPAPVAAPPSARHPIDIEKGNPYGP